MRRRIKTLVVGGREVLVAPTSQRVAPEKITGGLSTCEGTPARLTAIEDPMLTVKLTQAEVKAILDELQHRQKWNAANDKPIYHALVRLLDALKRAS